MNLYNKISGFSDEISEQVEEQFSVLSKLGIEYFEARGIGEKNISALCDEEVIILKEKMNSYGIKVSSIGSPIGKIKLGEDFNLHFQLFQKVVKIAKTLEAKYIRIFSFYHSKENDWTEQERCKILEQLRKMIEYAKEQDVILLHENEKNVYGDTIKRCVDLMKELSCSHFKAVFDPANFVQCGQDTKEAYEALKPYIAYVHIKDARSVDDKVVLAGTGDGNVEYILNELFKDGYNGFVSLEPHLGNFKGLKDLELDNKMDDLPQGGEGTFTLAYQALCDILRKIL